MSANQSHHREPNTARSAPSLGAASQLRSGAVAHLPGLRAHARKLCRDGDRAEDLVQATLLRALRFESTFRPDSNLRAWLHQILISVFIGNYRKSKRERRALARFSSDPCSWLRDRGEPEPKSLSPHVHTALQQLPQAFAQVVRSVDLQGQGYKDTATAAGIPLGTVMSRLFRGRRMLRLALSDAETTLRAA